MASLISRTVMTQKWHMLTGISKYNRLLLPALTPTYETIKFESNGNGTDNKKKGFHITSLFEPETDPEGKDTPTHETNKFKSNVNGINNKKKGLQLSSLLKPAPVTPDTDPDGIDIPTHLVETTKFKSNGNGTNNKTKGLQLNSLFELDTNPEGIDTPTYDTTKFKSNGNGTNKLKSNGTNKLKSNRNGTINKKKDVSSLFKPVPVTPDTDPDGIDIGSELVGELDKSALVKVLGDFYRRREVKLLSAENGLDNTLFHQVHVSFRRFCIESKNLPTELHIVLSDILRGAGHVDDLFPYFLGHAKYMFPHLDCKEDLKKISDLRLPANWYPEARAIRRKIIYHAGPTNSGKTYHALQSFSNAESGVYCGPLRMLANEVFHKTNETGTPCDLVTGEERKYVLEDENPAAHVSCTVEMTSVTTPYEIAVIDEIQMIRDNTRGWAWTRALLGLCAKEVHICGEASAIDFVNELVMDTGDELEVRHYKRLTKLQVLSKSIDNLDNILPGDCIVCFNKKDIYHASRQLEKRNKEVAVIYGTLPPGAKLHQAKRFNDPDDPCKILVATDAIGMGLNLNINRIIFYSLMKPTINEKGEKEIDVIPPSTALQIAGRAGRYGTMYEEGGKVTTFRANDLPLLKKLLNTDVDPIEQAGLNPTADQIELFSYHLPKATLSNIIDIFVTLCQLDNDKYFLCNVDDFKFLADMIEHIPLSLRSRYVFCCAPIPKKQAFVCTMFLKFARQFSREQPLTLDWVCRNIDWPFRPPSLIADLGHLEGVFDVLDLYLWLSYRFPDMFPDTNHIRDMQTELDHIIRSGISNITQLLKNSESGVSPAAITDDDEDGFEMNARKTNLRTLKRLQKQRDTGSYDDDFKDGDSSSSFASRLQQALQKRPDTQQATKKRPDTAFDSRIGIEDDESSSEVNKQTLTDNLLKQGILTKEMLETLKREWTS